MIERSDQWNLRGGAASKSDIEAYARRVAELYLWAPVEHEQRIERMLAGACRRLGIDPSTFLENIRKSEAPDGQDV